MVMYLDDGLAGANTMSDSVKLSLEVQRDLKKTRFYFSGGQMSVDTVTNCDMVRANMNHA